MRQFIFMKHIKQQINQKAEIDISNLTGHRKNKKAPPLHLLHFLETIFWMCLTVWAENRSDFLNTIFNSPEITSQKEY